MANESWVTGKKYRILTDLANKKWSIISFINKAVDTIFNDGKSAETKVGAIDGITSDLNGESETIAASIKAVNQLNNNLKGFELILDDTGKITGYKTSIGGADTVFPFRNGVASVLEFGTSSITIPLGGSVAKTIAFEEDYTDKDINVYISYQGSPWVYLIFEYTKANLVIEGYRSKTGGGNTTVNITWFVVSATS